MLELILVRHGETDSNVKGTYLGWTDVELNEKGKYQAACAADKLKGCKVDKIFASPLKRAFETAHFINAYHNTEILCMDELKERNFGAWDDLTFDEIQKRYGDEYQQYKNDWKNYIIPGGESSVQAYQRVTGFIDRLVDGHESGTFMIVSHLGCVRKIIAHLLGMGLDGSWRFRVENCGIVRIQVNDEKYAYLTALNA